MESMFLIAGGREFQRCGAERLNALDPIVDNLNGKTLSEMEDADLRDREGVSTWMRSDK